MFDRLRKIAAEVRGEAEGALEIRTTPDGEILGSIPIFGTDTAGGSLAGSAGAAESVSADLDGGAEGCISAVPDTEAESAPTGSASAAWREAEGDVRIPDGEGALYFTFRGKGSLDFRSFCLR